MSKKDLSYYINKDVSIIKCKKRAKELFNQNKNSEYKTLSQYKDLAAIELGFKSWFELQNTVKKKCELKFNIWEQQLTNDFDVLLQECLSSKLSDIHIEVRQPHGRIKTRINGELVEYKKEESFSYDYLSDFSELVLNKIFYNQNVNLNDFSTGSALYKIKNEQAIIRIQSVPAYPSGFDLVLRVRHSEMYNDFSSLIALGYAESHVKEILDATSHNNGCFILAGVTGQGKTTTLRTLLNQLHSKGNRKVTSIENSIEYPKLNKGITQIQCVIPYKYDSEYSVYEESVKKAISERVEVILTDDTRCKNTARTMKQSQDSALFLTSVHASSAINITLRLEDFGITKETITSPNFCRVLAYQALLPVLCSYCSKDIKTIKNNKDKEHYVEYLDSVQNKYPGFSLGKVKIRNHDGCTKCNYGISSRTVCAEVVILDENICQLIKNNDLYAVHNYWKNLSDKDLLSDDMRGKTSYEHALSKMLIGQIDPMDVRNKFG